jgi:hypothetical protein
MDEEKGVTNESVSNDDGNQPKEVSPIEQANIAVKRMEEENARLERNIAELSNLRAAELIGGRTNAGKQDETQKEETPREYMKRVMSNQL